MTAQKARVIRMMALLCLVFALCVVLQAFWNARDVCSMAAGDHRLIGPLSRCIEANMILREDDDSK